MKKLIFILLVFFSANCAESQVLEQDSLALDAIYNSTNGVAWTHNDFWLMGGVPVSWWYGVQIQGNRVSRLDLPYNGLSGHLPEETGNLDSLRFLDLAHDTILSLPHSIGNLVTLDTLNLFAATIDTLPTEIGNLTDLRFFSFGYTQIRYLPEEIGGLVKLEVLTGSNGQLRNIPESIGNMTALKFIYLPVNDIANLPPGIGNCTNLEELHLNANQIPEVPEEIGNLENLEHLILGGNCLNDLPDEIFTLTNLTDLNFAANNIDEIPASIGNLTKLRNFQFFKNEITSIPDEIGNLTDMTWIIGYSNNIDALPLSLLNLTGITVFNISQNALTFEDLEPMVLISGFDYQYQDSIDSHPDTTVVVNSPFRFECLTGGEYNHYQWIKDNDTLAGATEYYLEFPAVTFADSGAYLCVVTNSIATELTLYSKPSRLHVKDYTQIPDFEKDDHGKILIYPNPANSEFYIKSTNNEPATILISTLNNQLVKKVTLLEPDVKIDTDGLPNGIYLIKYFTASSLSVGKLIIE